MTERVKCLWTPVSVLLCMSVLLWATPASAALPDGEKNVIIYWTEGPKLKGVTLTCLQSPPSPVGIVSIPLYTVLEDEESEKEPLTVERYYHIRGREALTARLEKLFGTSIDSYVHVRQKTLQHFSDIIGPLRVGGHDTSLAEVFEGTYVKQPVNLQWEIRCLAGSMLTPSMVWKIPRLVWVYCSELDSNLGVEHVLALHRIIRHRGPDVLQKQRVPGKDFHEGKRRYRRVAPPAWGEVLRAVTTPDSPLRASVVFPNSDSLASGGTGCRTIAFSGKCLSCTLVYKVYFPGKQEQNQPAIRYRSVSFPSSRSFFTWL